MRQCEECGELLVQRANEKPGRFATRRFCSRRCAALVGSRRAAEVAETEAVTNPPKPIYRNGYRMIWVRDAEPPPSQKRKRGAYKYEHRLVMEQYLDRKLRLGEVVHHVNHDRLDNRPKNLRLYASQGEHRRAHGVDSGQHS